MERKYNKKLIPTAKTLRKTMTKEERHLWYDFLKDYPLKFVRQKVLGRYIADFYCAKVKLVIELDGSHHYTDDGIEYDMDRNEYLNNFGLTVIHIPNSDINSDFIAVCDYIDSLIQELLAGNTTKASP